MMPRVPSTATLICGALLGVACAKPPAEPAASAAKTPAPKKEPAADPRYETLPEPGPAPAWAPPSAKKESFDNGMSVWHMPSGTAPLVSVHLILPAGTAEDPAGKEGLTYFAADMLDEGAGKYSALELSDRLGQLATDYSSSAGVDYVLLSMSSLTENLDESLSLLADIVRRPRLSMQEFERRKEQLTASALAAQDDPRRARGKALGRALFGTDYGSGSPSGTVESLSSLRFSEIKRRVGQVAVPDGAHITFAGSVDYERALELSRKYFQDWKGQRPEIETQVAKAPVGDVAYVVDFPGAAQSSLALAIRANAEGDPNQIAEDVMFEKIGGSFTGRINMNLREDKGYTYGAFSVFQRYNRAGFFAVVADVKSETTIASIKEIQSELAAICADRPLTQEERDAAVDGLLLGYPLQFDQVESVGLRLSALPMKGRPLDYWTLWPERVQSITLERANRAGKPYCDPKKYSVIIAGDAQAVTPGLTELGLAVVAVDRNGEVVESQKEK